MALEHPRSGLAPTWLDTELLRNKLPLSARFFREITRTSKMSRAILPVFFNQADACLVTGGVLRRWVNSIRRYPRRSASWRILARTSCPPSALIGEKPLRPTGRIDIARPVFEPCRYTER